MHELLDELVGLGDGVPPGADVVDVEALEDGLSSLWKLFLKHSCSFVDTVNCLEWAGYQAKAEDFESVQRWVVVGEVVPDVPQHVLVLLGLNVH